MKAIKHCKLCESVRVWIVWNVNYELNSDLIMNKKKILKQIESELVAIIMKMSELQLFKYTFVY